MTFLVVANFKSNLTQAEVKAWLKAVKPAPGMVVAPSFPHLPLFSNLASSISLCAQNVSPFPQGSYTGEVNASQLKELGVSYCLVGHSERRRYFHESPTDVANKVKELVEVGITPLICMEENDIAPQFGALDPRFYDQCFYCFEPGDGLGGTSTASLPDIQNVQSKISQFVKDARFIYGGSVTPDNVGSLLSLDLSGLLVATASLDPSSYMSIVQKVSHVG